MKKLITLVLVAGLGLFALGCGETATETTPPASDPGTMPADPETTDPAATDPADPAATDPAATDPATPPAGDTAPPANP